MKSLSGTLTLVVLAAIGLVVTLTLRAFAQTSSSKFTLTIEHVAALKDGSDNGKAAFKDTLKKYGKRGYHVRMVHGNKPDERVDGNDEGNNAKLDIKTDKVTKSEIVKSASGEELTLIQVHVTQNIATRTAADMAQVLAALQ
jgi:hypothetical protein